MLAKGFKYLLCYTVSIVISSYLLIFSLAFTNKSFCSQKSINGALKQVAQSKLKKDCSTLTCGYLKFVAPGNMSEKVLKAKPLELPEEVFCFESTEIVSCIAPASLQVFLLVPDKPVFFRSLLI